MEDLNEFQDAWKSQKSDNNNGNKGDAFNQQFQAIYEKNQKETRYLKSTFIGTTLILSATVILFPTPLYIFGITLIVIAMLIIYLVNENNKASLLGKGLDASNKVFLTQNIQFLENRRALTSKYMPLYATLLILGLNLGYIPILELFELDSIGKILVHLGLTVLMGLAFFFSLRTHLKKFDNKAQPIINHYKMLLEEQG